MFSSFNSNKATNMLKYKVRFNGKHTLREPQVKGQTFNWFNTVYSGDGLFKA